MILSDFGLNRRGTYSIITTFFFIIVVLVVIIGLTYYSTIILQSKKIMADQISKYDLARSTKDAIYQCYGRTVFRIDKINTSQSCITFGEVIGYEVIQYDNGLNCQQKNFTFGNPTSNYQIFHYLIPIVQNDTKTTCLGKLIIHLK